MAVTVLIEENQVRQPEDQEVLLFQSVRELLMNSCKHSGTSRATIKLQSSSSRLCIEVIDEGKGFEVAAAETRRDLSSKFGLFSIQERMKALGGSFEIKSETGQGTRCILALPLSKDSIDQIVISPPGESFDVPLAVKGTIRIILVDDHAMVRQGLRSLLESYPDIEIVAEAADGVEALRMVDQFLPAIVVMDINMPRMNGIQATATIKAKYPFLHVIGLSVNAGRENSQAMLKAGARALLTKELAVERLYDVIHEAICCEIV